MRIVRILSFLLIALTLTTGAAFAQEDHSPAEAVHGEGEKKKLDVAGEMFGHVGDSHEWHLFGMSGHPVAVPLPIIAYTPTKGLSVFSASNFNFHEMEERTM